MANPYAASFVDETETTRLRGFIDFEDPSNQPGGGNEIQGADDGDNHGGAVEAGDAVSDQGGSVSIAGGGVGDVVSDGGSVNIEAGDGGASSGEGGSILIRPGTGDTDGNFQVQHPATNAAAFRTNWDGAGDAAMLGDTPGDGNGGVVQTQPGSGDNGGNSVVQGGSGSGGASLGGHVEIRAGEGGVSNGEGGSVYLTPGLGDTDGHVLLRDAQSTAQVSVSNGIVSIAAAASALGFFEEPPGAQQTVTGALSTVIDADAKAVLSAIIDALVAYGLVVDGTT